MTKPPPTAPAIELSVREIGQLFQSLDPLPFHERDLDSAVEEYVVGWARELPRSTPINIRVHLPETQTRSAEAATVDRAFRNYFTYRAKVTGQDLRELFRIGRLSLIIGLGVLAVCVVAGTMLSGVGRRLYLGRFFDEGLIILGWVACWRPIQIFLYDWWPIALRRRLYQRLADATIKVEAD
jgi:hypothetical protein